LDGTLADITHRLHFLQGKKDYDGFYQACVDDKPIEEMINLAWALKAADGEIWITSGRNEQVMAETAYWLDVYGVPHEALLMRHYNDYRSDDIIKQEMLDNMLDVDRERISMVFDDRERVVAMWRRNGLRCLQVALGDF
jgi:hypothetical protein